MAKRSMLRGRYTGELQGPAVTDVTNIFSKGKNRCFMFLESIQRKNVTELAVAEPVRTRGSVAAGTPVTFRPLALALNPLR